jgi:hypothetical protein
MDNSYSNFNNLKENAIEQLKSNYLKGNLQIEEYETRVAQVLNCSDVMQIEKILIDLPKMEITESESISCKLVTKTYEGTILQTKKLSIKASKSNISIDYHSYFPFINKQEICVDLDISTLILKLPNDVAVENRVEEKMLTYKDNRSSKTKIEVSRKQVVLTGFAKISNIIIED